MFSNKYTLFLAQVGGIIDFCESAGIVPSELGFDVKMPQTDDFEQFVKNLNSLQIILQQCPYFNVDGERIEIHAVDIGSIWMRFAIIATTSSIALSNIATAVDKCVKVASHMTTYRQQQEEWRMQKVADDLLASMIENHKNIINHETNMVVEELQNELNKDNEKLSPEDVQRLKTSMEHLINLMDKGMEIYASVNAPQEVKDKFPTSDEIKSLNEPIKMLTEETETE